LHGYAFEPAGLQDTGVFGYDDAGAVSRGHLPLQPFGLGKPRMLALPRWNYSMIQGAAAVFTTARDLYRWDRFLARVERTRPDFFLELISAEHGYAAGWEVNDAVMEHDGEDPGYFAYLLRSRDTDTTALFVSGTQYSSNSNYGLADNLRSLVLEKPFTVVAETDP
jgi:CubicO group peptidase (beta-lactamase class C family)